MRQMKSSAGLPTTDTDLVTTMEGAHKVQVIPTDPVTECMKLRGKVDRHGVLPLLVFEIHLRADRKFLQSHVWPLESCNKHRHLKRMKLMIHLWLKHVYIFGYFWFSLTPPTFTGSLVAEPFKILRRPSCSHSSSQASNASGAFWCFQGFDSNFFRPSFSTKAGWKKPVSSGIRKQKAESN